MIRTFLCLFASAVSLPAASTVKTVAGNGGASTTGDGKPASEASLHDPFGLARGPDGSLYVCEFNGHVVRRIDDKGGIISTVAGNGTPAIPATADRR